MNMQNQDRKKSILRLYKSCKRLYENILRKEKRKQKIVNKENVVGTVLSVRTLRLHAFRKSWVVDEIFGNKYRMMTNIFLGSH